MNSFDQCAKVRSVISPKYVLVLHHPDHVGHHAERARGDGGSVGQVLVLNTQVTASAGR